jgi:transcriptional regulator with XRE-family HTH domain
MSLGEKVRYLREVEGTLRGIGRTMTQLEEVRAVREELGSSLSQAYLSQVENGRRKHLTDDSRMLLARFFNVHPGYLVSDPEGFSTELISEVRTPEDALDLWLVKGAEHFERDGEIREALLAMAKYPDSRKCLTLMHAILEEPGLADRLLQALDPKQP